jgi:hypothetical protein
MATDFFLRGTTSSVGGAGDRILSQRRGRAASTAGTSATAGGTNIQVTISLGGQALQWFSEPITETVTISGTVTPNIRGNESANTVNAGAGVLIERCNNAGAVQSTIVADTVVGAEYGTSDAARTANLTPTSTAMAVGERIKVTLKVRNVGTMAAGTVFNSYNGPAAGASGDTYVRFAENIRTDEVIDVQQPEIYGSNGYRV